MQGRGAIVYFAPERFHGQLMIGFALTSDTRLADDSTVVNTIQINLCIV